jgi:hypothetical protein
MQPLSQETLLQLRITALMHRSWQKNPRPLQLTRLPQLTYLQRRIPRQMLAKRNPHREATLAMQRLRLR